MFQKLVKMKNPRQSQISGGEQCDRPPPELHNKHNFYCTTTSAEILCH